MKPEKLRICGWGPYKDLTEIDFHKFGGQGLFLITGATGAGKTTIFDAITYALYGALSGEVRDKERDSVRSDFAGEDTPTYVELEMTHGGVYYYIKRNPEYLRPKKRSGGGTAFTKEKENAVLRMEDKSTVGEYKVIEGVKEVNTFIRELLSLDYVQFKQLSMIAQGEFARLLTASPKDKTKIFREIFGTGVYERFTFLLGQKAKQQYQGIMEQKHRLEEIVRLLEESVVKSRLSEEDKETFAALISAKNWNYEALENYLSEQRKAAKKALKAAEEEFDRTERSLAEKNEQLTRMQEENKRIGEYIEAMKQKEILAAQKEEIDRKAYVCQKAANAGWVEPGEVRLQNAEKQYKNIKNEKAAVAADMESIEIQLEELRPIWEKRSLLEAFLQDLAACEKEKTALQALEKVLREKEQQESAQKEAFLREERDCVRIKQEYEEAVRAKRLAAIGMAAELLEEGKPCPVCGSPEHPAPAPMQEGILTEEELEGLKVRLETAEESVNQHYREVVTLQEQVKNLRENQGQSFERVKMLEVSLEETLKEDAENIFTKFYRQKASAAMRELQHILEKVQKLQVILQEKQIRQEQLQSMILDQKQECEKAAAEFEELLAQYGFLSREAYEQAHLPKAEREGLAKEVEDYRRRSAANGQLLEHLEQVITAKTLLDVEPLKEEIQSTGHNKDALLKEVKQWEQLLGELDRTYRELHTKRQQLEKLSNEYGRIKELENIASGNNAKKLVFEQYVLAGYFEEILNAANIRFQKMSAGRYEMHRAREVGDGRTKDNLEILVMDYYTGKQRSIRTLSGGESFKASLSLALGLSDVIQAMNGGIRVEALFIDEGFGALDSESLDQACETLLSLVESDRLIGIISHVPELRERIGKQIVIDKKGNGSALKIVV